jgi:predicted dienelactone hydrolase
VDENLRAPHTYRVVAKAGHFAFLTPCPPEAVAEHPMLCRDAPDFDRVAFHREFNDAVLAFFRAHLQDSAPH